MASLLSQARKFVAQRTGALASGLGDLVRAPRRRAKRRAAVRPFSLMPNLPPQRRTLDDWKRLRKRTLQIARQSLDDDQPNPAILLLSRGLVEDPHHLPYRDLLQRAATIKRKDKGVGDHRLSWAEASPDLHMAAVQLEAFVAYAHELAKLMSKAGIKSWAPGQPRRK